MAFQPRNGGAILQERHASRALRGPGEARRGGGRRPPQQSASSRLGRQDPCWIPQPLGPQSSPPQAGSCDEPRPVAGLETAGRRRQQQRRRNRRRPRPPSRPRSRHRRTSEGTARTLRGAARTRHRRPGARLGQRQSPCAATRRPGLPRSAPGTPGGCQLPAPPSGAPATRRAARRACSCCGRWRPALRCGPDPETGGGRRRRRCRSGGPRPRAAWRATARPGWLCRETRAGLSRQRRQQLTRRRRDRPPRRCPAQRRRGRPGRGWRGPPPASGGRPARRRIGTRWSWQGERPGQRAGAAPRRGKRDGPPWRGCGPRRSAWESQSSFGRPGRSGSRCRARMPKARGGRACCCGPRARAGGCRQGARPPPQRPRTRAGTAQGRSSRCREGCTRRRRGRGLRATPERLAGSDGGWSWRGCRSGPPGAQGAP